MENQTEINSLNRKLGKITDEIERKQVHLGKVNAEINAITTDNREGRRKLKSLNKRLSKHLTDIERLEDEGVRIVDRLKVLGGIPDDIEVRR